MKDDNWGVRVNAADYLIDTDNENLLKLVIETLENDTHENVRKKVLNAKEKAKSLSVSDLVNIIKDNNESDDVRDDAMMKLSNIQDIEALEALINYGLKRDPSISFYQPGRAAIFLRSRNDNKTVPYLVEIIKNAKIMPTSARAIKPDVYWSINLVGNWGDQSLIPILEDLKAKILERGIKEEYVVTSDAAGKITTKDDVHVIDSTIESLKSK